MDVARALEFIRSNHRGVLATQRHDGRPQLSPVLASVDTAGRVVVSSREPAYKVRNVLARPYASYCALPDAFFGDWVQVEGAVEVVPLPEAMEALVEYYRSISGEHPNWDEYRTAMVRERRVALLLTVERAGPDRSG